MTKYQIPSEHYYRIHHVRPRFKNNVEEVLLFIASNLTPLEPGNKPDFIKNFDTVLKMFPGNLTKTKKTIANWRTEISSLFGFLVELSNGSMYAGNNATVLSEKQDIVEFFKYFLYTFQYPGGHMKPHETAKMIEQGIKFRPASYILSLLVIGKKITGSEFSIDKAETTHCIFNDLRVTTQKIKIEDVANQIIENRKKNVDYDWDGDVIRYAGDILDYMTSANLIEKHGSNYYLNKTEKLAIDFFINHQTWFEGFDVLYDKKTNLTDIKKISSLWYLYVNSYAGKIKFETDLLDFIGIDKASYKQLLSKSQQTISTSVSGAIPQLLGTHSTPKSKIIGDAGEALVHGHECMILKKAKKNELIPKVVILPNHLAMGYDIRSFDIKSNIKNIEVKSTISTSSLSFYHFHLTDNEWNIADKLGNDYFVYRLQLSRKDNNEINVKLFVIQNPIEKYKKGLIQVKSKNGIDVTFNKKSGHFEELVIWEN
jgi:hypothetical protein